MQIYINRTVPLDDLLTVETLRGYTFTKEQAAHIFDITCTENGDPLPLDGEMEARFKRADGTSVILTDGINGRITNDGRAWVELAKECYEVPGRFELYIYNLTDYGACCIYAAVGMVQPADGTASVTPSEGTVERFTALYALNVSQIESDIQTFDSKVQAVREEYADMKNALLEIDVDWKKLVTPNLLSQEYWTHTGTAYTLFSETARYFGSNRPYINTFKAPVATTTDGTTTYSEGDEISEALITLTGSDIVTESNGERFDHAIAFTVSNAPEQGYNNSDDLVFNHGTDAHDVTDETTGTTTHYNDSGIITELVDGHFYTLACWARVTSGTQMRLIFKYGNNQRGYVISSENLGNQYIEDISNTEWKRITWGFTFHNSLSYTAPNPAESSSTTCKKRVSIGVCRKYNGTVQLCGFRMVEGSLYGLNTVDVLANRVEQLEAQLAELQATVLENA